MYFGSTIMACLLMAANPGGAPDVPAYLNTPMFSIPLRIQNERRNDIKEVLLYLSRDKGLTWVPLPGNKLGEASVPYRAPADGLYLFKVATVFKSGQREPADIAQGPVGLKIVVDTVKPDIRLSARREGGEIVAQWSIDELNPDPENLILEYQSAEAGPTDPWFPVLIPVEKREGKGEQSFPAPIGGVGVKVRLSLTDMAKNVGKAEAVVASLHTSGTGLAGNNGGGDTLHTGGQELIQPEQPRDPPPLATTHEQPSQPNQYGRGSSLGAFNTGALPPLTVVKSLQVKVDFEVARCGPSGLGTADVWLTPDEGQHWDRAQKDVPVIGADGSAALVGGPLRVSVMVSLPHTEQIYGIYLIVKSGAGLGLDPPAPGQVPQMRVEVDMQAPVADLLAPIPDQTRENGVIFLWRATDRNLEVNPITLEYGDTPNGPWKLIGPAALPNTGGAELQYSMGTGPQGPRPTGKFAWTIPYDIPNGRAYLRLTVRDLAGNVAVAVTQVPVLFDTTRPQLLPGKFTVSCRPNN
jgi:hypothetical protein